MSDDSRYSANVSSVTQSDEDAEKGNHEAEVQDVVLSTDITRLEGINAWKMVFGTQVDSDNSLIRPASHFGSKDRWLIQFCTYGYTSAFGVYQEFYTQKFLTDNSPSEISWIGSFQLFMQYAPGAIVGIGFDSGYFSSMIAVGSVLQVFSMLMLSLARPGKYFEVFLAQAVGMGMGQALLFLPSLTILGQHFRHRRALATGIAVSGASVGGIIWPIMLNKLIDRISFANAIRATAGTVALLLCISNLVTKVGVRPEVAVPSLSWKKLQVIIQDSAYIVSVASAFCVNLGLFFPYFYLQLFALDKGVNPILAFNLLTIMNCGSVLGRILPNFLADRFGPYNLLIPCLVISSALTFSIFGIANFGGLVIFGLLYGFWSGSYVSLIPSLLAELSPDKGEQGLRMGVAFSIVGFSLLFGTPIEGALLSGNDRQYHWHRAVSFCSVMVMCGAVGMTISKLLFVHRNRGKHAQRA